MKNKLAILSVLGLGLFITGSAYAASGVRGAKAIKMAQNSTTAVPVSKGATAVYAVILGTGAVTDFVVLFDSANYTAAAGQTQGASFRGRFGPTSTTGSTIVTFDPPLQFDSGLTIVNATALTANGVVYEPGRVTQGY